MKRLQLLISLCALAVFAAACNMVGDEEEEPCLDALVCASVQESGFSITADSIVFELYNSSKDTLYHTDCISTSIEEFDGSAYRTEVMLPVCLCECPVRIFPGEVKRIIAARPGEVPDTIEYWEEYHGTTLSIRSEYTYRLRLDMDIFEGIESRRGLSGVMQSGPLHTGWFKLME